MKNADFSPPNEIKSLIEAFKKSIIKVIQDKFASLIIFGSYSRGDFTFGSDIDLLVLLNSDLSVAEDNKISDITTDLSLKFDVVISCFKIKQEEFIEYQTPFLMNIRNEGLRV